MTKKVTETSSEKLVAAIVEAIADKKGHDIITIDLREVEGSLYSYMVICNADSTTQVSAIAVGVEDDVRDKTGEKIYRMDGMQNALWVALDYVDVVVHIFQTEMRQFYKLEQLWADAPVVRYESAE